MSKKVWELCVSDKHGVIRIKASHVSEEFETSKYLTPINHQQVCNFIQGWIMHLRIWQKALSTGTNSAFRLFICVFCLRIKPVTFVMQYSTSWVTGSLSTHLTSHLALNHTDFFRRALLNLTGHGRSVLKASYILNSNQILCKEMNESFGNQTDAFCSNHYNLVWTKWLMIVKKSLQWEFVEWFIMKSMKAKQVYKADVMHHTFSVWEMRKLQGKAWSHCCSRLPLLSCNVC